MKDPASEVVGSGGKVGGDMQACPLDSTRRYRQEHTYVCILKKVKIKEWDRIRASLDMDIPFLLGTAGSSDQHQGGTWVSLWLPPTYLSFRTLLHTLTGLWQHRR